MTLGINTANAENERRLPECGESLPAFRGLTRESGSCDGFSRFRNGF